MIRKRFLSLPLGFRLVLCPFVLVLMFIFILPFAVLLIAGMVVFGEDTALEFLEKF